MNALDWLSLREEPRTPSEVYRDLMDRQEAAYATLREAALGLVYLLKRLEAETFERRAEIARLHDEATRLARRGADQRALEILGEKQARMAELTRQEETLARVRDEAEAAKARLFGSGRRMRSMQLERLEAETTRRATEAVRHTAALADGDQSLLEELRSIAHTTVDLDPPELVDDTSARLDLAVLKHQP